MTEFHHLINARKIDLLLGTESSINLSERVGRRVRKLQVRRIGKSLVEVSFRDFDGSKFKFTVDPQNGAHTLVVPFLQGSVYEELMLRELWKTAMEMLMGTRASL